jgi:putative transposase
LWRCVSTQSQKARWLSADKKTGTKTAGKRGRPRIPDEIRELILRFARENDWGLGKIHGELKKLGIRVSEQTVKNILREEGFGPERGKGTWNDFIRRHVETLWACDFFTKRIVTPKGFVDMFVLFFIHVGSRRVFVSGTTANPDGIWMAQQARNLSMVAGEGPKPATHLILDLDTKFTAKFEEILIADGITPVRTAPRRLNMNAFVERFAQTVKRESLDHFVVLGEKHLRYLIDTFLRHYHRHRPRQGLDNWPPDSVRQPEPAILAFTAGKVECEEQLGGLLKHYYRKAT